MTSLRERRRIETARQIQLVTLELTERNGFEKVTTEAISRHAGLSPRTFFNYYANKEAAIMGSFPTIPQAAIDCFACSKENIPKSLRKLMWANIMELKPRYAELIVMQQLTDKYPKISQIRLSGMKGLCNELSEVLRLRLPDYSRLSLVILSEILLSSCWSGVEVWLNGELDLEMAFEKSWSALRDVSKLLSL